MKEEDVIELFDSYTSGALDDAARKNIEERMKSDDAFRRDYEHYLMVVNVVKSAGAGRHIRSLMDADKGRSVRYGQPFVWLSAAACLIVVILWIWPSDKPSHEALFAKYYQPYPNILTSRSDSPTRMQAAMDAFTARNYSRAVSLLQEEPSKTDTLYFYLGVTQLSLGRPGDAISAFNQVGETSIFYQHVRWYRGLAYVRQKDSVAARREFEKLIPGDFKYDEAQKLLNSL